MYRDLSPYLQRAYALTSSEEAESLYDEWANTYNSDLLNVEGYVAPAIVAAKLAELVEPTIEVLDAGCGTGLAGIELARRGFSMIDGLDLSKGMLEMARKTGAYRNLVRADLTEPIPVEDKTYGALMCVGTLTQAHVGPEVFTEFVRVTASGGPVVATVLEAIWESGGYRAAVQDLTASGTVELRETNEQPYRTAEGATCRQVVFTVV